MKEESLFKRSLILTSKLLGVFVLWTAILSVVAVVGTGHVIALLSGRSAAGELDPGKAGDAGKEGATDKSPGTNAHRPNG